MRSLFLRALALGALAAAALGLGAPPLAAAAPPRLRVLVRVTSAEDLALATRLRGHASDLPVELTDVPSARLEPRLPARLAAADLLARQLTADVVIWNEPGAADLFVARPAPGYVLTLPRDRPAGAGARRSAELEQTALRLRRALKTLLDGGVVGTRVDQLAPEAAAAAPARADAPPAPTPSAAPEPGVYVTVGLGAQQLFDGPPSTTGLTGRAGLGLGRLEATLFADFFRDRRAEGTFSDFELGRRTFGLEGRFALYEGAHVALQAVGALALARFDFAEVDGDERDGREASRPVVSAGLRARFPILRAGPTFRLDFWAAALLDALVAPPRFEGYRFRWDLAPLEPRVAIGIEARGG